MNKIIGITARTGVRPAALHALWLAALPLTLAAEPPGVVLSVPVLGYVFDPATQTVRQATGVPGAASLEGAATGSLKAAWVHSGARLAVAITKDGETAVVNWSAGAAQTKALATGLSGLKGASLSASGNAAVLHDGSSAEVWTNLLSQPAKTATYSGDTVVAAAVRDDGTAALAVGAGNIVLVTGSDSRVIASGSDWKALAFTARGSDLIAASSGELVRFTGIDGNPGRGSIAALESAPSAIQVAADGSKIAVAVEKDILLVAQDGAVSRVACDCSASGFSTFAGNLVASIGGLSVFDADSPEPRVFELLQITGGAQ